MEIERRHTERTAVNLDAELISDGVSYAGTLENLSEDGIFIKTAHTKNAIDFTPGKIFQVKFQPSPGETLNLSCEAIWFYTETSSMGLIFSIGMKIINVPQRYKEFLEVL